ncbi:MAG: hypothetical protein KJ070_17710 [Verrucomicrobia bacterium]|nr:hypothetical protein [Verrucomicrobiota bacterium]
MTATLEDLRRDEKWYSKASDAIVEYWRHKNSRKGQDTSDHEPLLPSDRMREGSRRQRTDFCPA